jgi:muconolactone delta-isomerase
MIATVESLPIYGWMSIDAVPLAIHPDDTATSRLSITR